MKNAILINDTGFVFHFGCQTVIQNINNLCIKNNIKIISSLVLEEKNKINKIDKIIKQKKIKLIIINGEGTIHHNSKEGIELLKIGKHIKENFSEIKIIIINSTFQEIDNYLCYFKYFDLISVREPYSKNYLNENNINCFLTPDLSLYNTRFSYTNNSDTKNGIIYGGSVIKKIDNLLNNNNNSYKDIYYFIKGKNFIPSIFCKKIFFILYNKIIHSISYPYKSKEISFLKKESNYIKHLSRYNYLISGRFHDIYMGIKAGISFYLVDSNSYKIESTLNYIGLKNRRIKKEDIRNIKIQRFTLDELNKIKQFIYKGQKDIENLFIKISKLG